MIDSHASVWLRSEDLAFGALPQLQCSPNTFPGERRWLHSAFFLSFSSNIHTFLGTPRVLKRTGPGVMRKKAGVTLLLEEVGGSLGPISSNHPSFERQIPQDKAPYS